jgi:uncharacterized membrane protein
MSLLNRPAQFSQCHVALTTLIRPSNFPRARYASIICSSSLTTRQPDDNGSKTDKLAEAFKSVEKAIAAAENTVSKLDQLPSARLPTKFDKFLTFTKPAVQSFILFVGVGILHGANYFHIQALGSLAVALVIGWKGYTKSSLSPSGALSAIIIGWVTLWSSFRAGLVLLAFFFSSSFFTRLSDQDKSVIDEEHKQGGQRDWVQVVCNGLIPAVLTAYAAYLSNGLDLPLFSTSSLSAPSSVSAIVRDPSNVMLAQLHGAFLGYFAACCGDTWASEIGQLSSQEPKLVTTLRPVRKGTNGGVTFLGLAASCAGGLFIGLVYWFAGLISPTGNFHVAVHEWKIVPVLGLVAGLLGSLVDSVLGATIQFTGYNRKTGKITGKSGEDVTAISGVRVLDNNMVNLVSASVVSLLAGLVVGMI